MYNNPNAGIRNPQGPGRRIKHVSDVNAMGMPSAQPAYMPGPAPTTMPMESMGTSIGMGNNFNVATPQVPVSIPYGNAAYNNGGYVQTPMTASNQVPQVPGMAPGVNTFAQGMPPGGNTFAQGMPPGGNTFAQGMPGPPGQPQYGMFQQPIVQDMALQYGQRLADQGKQIVEDQLERWVSVSKLKYYFAVDNRYVINKLRLLFFPFTHSDWSLKYDQEKPVQPRYDINAPDLYIPAMAYITYVVVAGLMLGLQNRFSPEQLGIQASSALACSIFELFVYTITLYVSNIKTNLKTLDLVAFAGYKFVIIVACLLISTFFHGFGYYASLIYCSLSLGFFLLRTLRTKVLQENNTAANTGAINYDPYGNPQQLDYRGGRKRKLYFLFLIVAGQALISFMLSKHLYFADPAKLKVPSNAF